MDIFMKAIRHEQGGKVQQPCVSVHIGGLHGTLL
jgi:hypothetical protein